MKEVIILAGGPGTRLHGAVDGIQKAMAPVGGRPFITYMLDRLISFGCDRIIISVGCFRESVTDYLGNRYKSAQIIYSVEDEPLGTGGAIKRAFELCRGDFAPVINGDTYFEADLDALTEFHKSTGAKITLSVKHLYNYSRYGSVIFGKDGRVTDFREKTQTDDGFINAGVYCIDKDVFLSCPEKFSFEKEILEPLKTDIFALEGKGSFTDIGIPGDYLSSQLSIPLAAGRKEFKAAFIDRDGTLNKEKNYVHTPEEFEFIPGAVPALARLRAHGYLIIVITNQAGVAKGYYTEKEVKALHSYINEKLGVPSHIDAFYYCPYHENGTVEEYARPSTDRKPLPGMIYSAVADFNKKGINIDLEASVLIGDTEKDIQTGINAGVGRKILVLSGHTRSGEGTEADDTVKDLAAAADLILHDELFPWEKPLSEEN